MALGEFVDKVKDKLQGITGDAKRTPTKRARTSRRPQTM